MPTSSLPTLPKLETLQLKWLRPEGVLEVTLHRPTVRNAFNEVLIRELQEVFGALSLESYVRMLVLRGSGPVFCAGGDLNWMKRSVDLTAEENLTDTRELTRMFQTMNECPKPVIGVIHGAAIGGGVGLVSICDHVIATEDTQMSLSEVRLGIVPACIGPFVVAKIGASAARSLFITAERFQASRAQEIGLVHQVVRDERALENELGRVVDNMLQSGPQAMKIAKSLVLNLSWPEKRRELPDACDYVSKTLADLRVTPEGQEGLRAFLEKRKPGWITK
jgi:methylglutaconyl-CoA hydratase